MFNVYHYKTKVPKPPRVKAKKYCPWCLNVVQTVLHPRCEKMIRAYNTKLFSVYNIPVAD